jgi:succinoglycan biosynthesis protein ExoU
MIDFTDHFAANGKSGEAAVSRVDVVVAARDRADTIQRAVHSALAQEEVRAVIVIDDGSTDDTAARARRCDLDGKRVWVERLRSSLGPSAARNIAIELSQAPWLAILDGDDFFLPGRISTLLAVADNWDFVADDLLQVPDPPDTGDARATLLGASLGASLKQRSLNLEQFILGNIPQPGLVRKELSFLKPLIRRSFLDRHKLRYDEALRLGEDYEFYARALAAGARFLVHPVAGYVSLVRKDSLSARHTRQELELFRDSDCKLLETSTLTPNERRAVAKHYSSVDCRVQLLNVIEAIKSGNCSQFLTAFFRSPGAALFITRCLIDEAMRKSRRSLGMVRQSVQ